MKTTSQLYCMHQCWLYIPSVALFISEWNGWVEPAWTLNNFNAGHGGQLERKKNINSKQLSSKERLVCKLLLVRCCAVQLLCKVWSEDRYY